MAAYLAFCNYCDTVMWDDNHDADTSHDFDEDDLGMDLSNTPEQLRHPEEHHCVCPVCLNDDCLGDVTIDNVHRFFPNAVIPQP